MHTLEDFMDYLTHEQDMFVQMGTIKYTKDKYLSVGISNQYKGNNKSKDSKQQRVKENKHSNVESSSSNDEDSKAKRMNNKRENPTCVYCRGSHNAIY